MTFELGSYDLERRARPNITRVTPTTPIAGTQITITGTGFGANQGGGNVWLGSTYGVIVSWSDTQIVATVASGSKSGVAQVLQGGVWSNSINLTVTTPNITSVTPTTAVAGTQITITGTGFGASQGGDSGSEVRSEVKSCTRGAPALSLRFLERQGGGLVL